jgi:hypothetical protein
MHDQTKVNPAERPVNPAMIVIEKEYTLLYLSVRGLCLYEYIHTFTAE